MGQGPQPPIPNPQSPIPIPNPHLKNYSDTFKRIKNKIIKIFNN
jgi:hypothetical protein